MLLAMGSERKKRKSPCRGEYTHTFIIISHHIILYCMYYTYIYGKVHLYTCTRLHTCIHMHVYTDMCVHICMHTESISAQIYPDTTSTHFFWEIQWNFFFWELLNFLSIKCFSGLSKYKIWFSWKVECPTRNVSTQDSCQHGLTQDHKLS